MLSLNDISFSYPSSIEPVLSNISVDFYDGWTGVIGDNGAGKSTLLKLCTGILEASAGNITGGGGVYIPQRTDTPLEGEASSLSAEDFICSSDGVAKRLISRLKIQDDWLSRWDTLSHGERKRFQLGFCLWGIETGSASGLLAVDEPTNHLDNDAKNLIAATLAEFRGVGLIVSHDRALLDKLCFQCLFLRAGHAVLRPGGVSAGLAEEEREALSAKRQRENLKAEKNRLAVELDRRQRSVAASKSRVSKKHVDPKDHDTKGKINLARLSGKDRGAADSYKQMQSRVGRLDDALSASEKTGERKTGVQLFGERYQGDVLCKDPLILPDDRIALSGPNGSGKTTLIKKIVKGLRESTADIPFLYIPQEITEDEGRQIVASLKMLNDKALGETLSRFSRLGSDPTAILQTLSPSPGELRKLMLAMGVIDARETKEPVLIIMDEPTNHLDLRSILLLEDMLKNCRSALLLVSHDEVFLHNLCTKEWRL
ncbi:MAG: ATP-binding cassette domain-containing protein [Spirochaetaceae bacterium]|jgi:ATPase subunit of ABC transporter with duplicated ATPase domains|nr:ATP-binding cassette domain-containing protein [Spirochaetaceae bacterium]